MNTQIIEIEDFDGTITKHIIIDRGNNEYTSMPLLVWEQQQAEQNDRGNL